MATPFPLPTKFQVTHQDEPFSDVMTLEPLYPGYGTTIGNALRRVLLSSLEGAAITSVKIEGVQHEFSTIPAVKEDVVSILLNLKALRFRLEGDEPATLTLKAKGERSIRGEDFKGPAQATIMTPDLVIATLTEKNATLEMEVTVEKGLGYLPVESREKEKLEIGRIAVDAIFTPVKNVNFSVEHVRVGQRTDFDRLLLTITTDGSVVPEEALRRATVILSDHFSFLLSSAAGEAASEAKAATTEEGVEVEDRADAEEKPKKKTKRSAA